MALVPSFELLLALAVLLGLVGGRLAHALLHDRRADGAGGRAHDRLRLLLGSGALRRGARRPTRRRASSRTLALRGIYFVDAALYLALAAALVRSAHAQAPLE